MTELNMIAIVAAVVAVILSSAICYLLASQKAAKLHALDAQKAAQQAAQLTAQCAALQATVTAFEHNHNALQNQLQQQTLQQRELIEQHQAQYAAQQQEISRLQADNMRLFTQQQERDAAHKEQVVQFEQQKIALQKEFELLANRIFEEKGKSFTATSQQSLDGLLKPFREQIEFFQKRVNDVHSESLRGNALLESEIKKVLETGLKMQDEASNLARALKGDSQKRGAWGQAQIERTLEASGLIRDEHYQSEATFKNADNKTLRPDYIVKLPDGKHIIIDSKVTLNAYDQLVSAETSEQQSLALDEHIHAVKRHIDDLAGKDYTQLLGVRSPNFTLMFMPIEPAYIEALKHQKDLFSYGYDKNVILVSHTTLVPILRTVANLWMLDRSNKEAREISDRAGDIFNQVCLVAERLHKLGGTLGTVSNHYNDAVKALVGQQGLYGKVERFATISSKVNKALPAIEPMHVDLQVERLLTALPDSKADDSNTDETLNTKG